MEQAAEQLGELIIGMRKAYSLGENVMAYARSSIVNCEGGEENTLFATLVAYDLQAGSYVAATRQNAERQEAWCSQIAELINPVLPTKGSILELGVGEATTLAGVLSALGKRVGDSYGFDISWSRIAVAEKWLIEKSQQAKLFVGNLLHIPLVDNSIDIVYSSHSLEPNGGLEEQMISECLRVARKAVVLVEPIYELASLKAQNRMREHRYIRFLKQTAEKLGAEIFDYRLLKHISNPLNPSGVLGLKKHSSHFKNDEDVSNRDLIWQCPMTAANLELKGDLFYAPDVGIAYPILRGIPMLSPDHAVIASQLG